MEQKDNVPSYATGGGSVYHSQHRLTTEPPKISFLCIGKGSHLWLSGICSARWVSLFSSGRVQHGEVIAL